MKKIFIAMMLVAFMAGAADADTFQFVDRAGNYFIANCGVYISNQLYGYTDGYGRIRINLPSGTHPVTLNMRKRKKTISLSFDGSSALKTVYVP